MKSKKVFLLAWVIYFFIMTMVFIGILTLSWYLKSSEISFFKEIPNSVFGSWTLLPFVYAYIVWKNKLIVPPEYEYIYEWQGEKLEPLKSGYNYIFPFFGFLKGRVKIPTNIQTLNILIGVRDGLPESITKCFVFGSAVNIRPEEGDTIRVLFKVEYQNIDSLKLFYAKNNPYDYIVSLIEFKVGAYMRKPIKDDSEALSDHFLSKNWDAEVLDSIENQYRLKDEIFDFIGVKLIHIIPVNLLFSPEIEEAKKKIEVEKRRRGLLEEELNNMNTEESIAKKRNEINSNEIEKVMKTANVGGQEALNFILKEKTLTAITQASKTGNITYIDGSGKDNFSSGVGFGWGLSANNSSFVPEKKPSENLEEKKGGKEKKVSNK